MAAGRPRAAAITLAGSYSANSAGKLINRPETPWRLPDMDLEAERRAFFGDDSAKAAEAEAKIRRHVRERTLRMKLEADNLGLLTGEYYKRPKVFPTQPTLERIARGKERGEILDKRPVLSDAGEELNESITEITPLLRMLKNKGTISETEYEAALRLCRDWYGAAFRGASTVRYDKIRVDGGGAHYESDYIIACRQRFARAVVAIGLDAAEVTAWIIKSMGDSEPLYSLGEYFARSPEELQSKSRLSTRGGEELRTVLRDLCRHYGMDPSRRRKGKLSPQAAAIVSVLPAEQAG